MFFTPELLAKRDSGFGLIWLAATLGSKSTFKKLPKRSVLTADISQLCDLIVQPAEPLALRLSSNLMVGVVRVYKVKQEIFMTDVTTCVNSLRKMVQEMRAPMDDTQFQMAQPTVRPGTVTLTVQQNPYAIDFDNMLFGWDERMNPQEEDSEDEYDPKAKKATKKQKQRGQPSSVAPTAEAGRADLYTLQENHEHLLIDSFSASFSGGDGIGGIGGDLVGFSSSSALGGGGGGNFDFDDNFFAPGENLDLGIGEDLARELGGDWGGPEPIIIDDPAPDMDLGGDFNLDMGGLRIGSARPSNRATPTPAGFDLAATGEPQQLPTLVSASQQLSPASFARQLLSQEEEGQGHPQGGTPIAPVEQQNKVAKKRNLKRAKPLVDTKLELSDDELRTARTNYLENQNAIRLEMEAKKFAQECGKVIDDLIWGVPTVLHAQDLKSFWMDNFKAQMEAQTTNVLQPLDMNVERPRKRRKDANAIAAAQSTPMADRGERPMNVDIPAFGVPDNFGGDVDIGMPFGYDHDVPPMDITFMRSSEEPGQARAGSRPMSVTGNKFGLDLSFGDLAGVGGGSSHSQRNSIFPWDNAAVSSSDGLGLGFGSMPGSDRIVIPQADDRLRRSGSGSRRDSPRLPASYASGENASLGMSPGSFRWSQLAGDSFRFNDPSNVEEGREEAADSEIVRSLERNSFNFYKYLTMQLQSRPTSSFLTFERDIVRDSRVGGARQLAAAGFYHCLVLATKDVIQLRQEEPYESLTIRIK